MTCLMRDTLPGLNSVLDRLHVALREIRLRSEEYKPVKSCYVRLLAIAELSASYRCLSLVASDSPWMYIGRATGPTWNGTSIACLASVTRNCCDCLAPGFQKQRFALRQLADSEQPTRMASRAAVWFGAPSVIKAGAKDLYRCNCWLASMSILQEIS